MTYTSDLQLQALGLKPMEYMPQREDFRMIARTRDGRDVRCKMWRYPGGALDLAIDAVDVTREDLIGWREA